MTKKKRHKQILGLIEKNVVGTQDLLATLLQSEGLDVTQATISRDIRELGLTKVQDSDGKTRYVSGHHSEGAAYTKRLAAIFQNSVTEVAVAQNLVVIKTLPGAAPAACSAIDGGHHDGVVGTLAGDDTAFLAMEDANAAKKMHESIMRLLD